MSSSAPMPRNSRKPSTPPAPGLQTWLAFAFGVIFVSVLLYLATGIKNPDPTAVRIYLTVLSLASAGVGAVLPGFMEVQYKGFFRAGGALALFALVYLNAPAIGSTVVRTVTPTVPSFPVVEKFLGTIDAGNPTPSWDMLPSAARAQVDNSESNWTRLYENARAPLGKVMSRTLVGESKVEASTGPFPPGVYKAYTFKSKFQKDAAYRMETVILRGNEKEQWEIFLYNISISTFG